MKKLIIIALIATTALISGCTFYIGPPRVLSETVSVPATASIAVHAVVGSVEIVGTDREDVAITAFVNRTPLTVFPASAIPIGEVRLDVDTSDGIVVRHAPFSGRGITVSYEIEVPLDLSVELVTSDTGSIVVENIAGNPTLATSTGSISADGVSGSVAAETATGSITIRNATAVSSLSSGTGSIRADVLGMPAGESVVPVTTSTGSIRLWIDPALNLSVSADTGTGSVTVDDDLDLVPTWESYGRLEATLNGGGTLLSVDSGTGSISFYHME